MRRWFWIVWSACIVCTFPTSGSADDLQLPPILLDERLQREQPKPLPLPGKFKGARYHSTKAEHQYRLQLSPFAAYYSGTQELGVGLGVWYSDQYGGWRPSLQFSQDHVGIAVTRILVPGVDFGVGVSYTRDLRDERWTPGLHCTVYRW